MIITIEAGIFSAIGTILLLVLLFGAGIWGAYTYGRRRPSQDWQTALRKMPLGVMLFNQDGQRTFANSSAEELLPQLTDTAIEQVRQGAVQGLPQSVLVSSGDGAVVRVQSQTLSNANTDVLITLWNIGEQQQAEANYHKLVHTLSHELMTPLTTTQLRLNVLASDNQYDEDDRQRSLQIARDEIERLIQLTSNLLYLSRLKSGKPLQHHPTNLAAVAEEAVLQLIDKAATRHITLNVQAAPQLARPSVDRDAWKQIFLNLIDNGIKYGSEGGRVDIVIQQDETKLNIAIVDDGPGIASDDIPHLFTEMFRAENQRHVSGSGLGLAIVRRIVEQHSGQITCTSQPGHGTTFQVTLPLPRQRAPTS